MRSLRWILGGVAVVVVLVVLAIAVGAAWLNTYIHSDAFKAEVESRAARSLGGTVQIGKVDFDIFTGVKLQGLVTQVDAAHGGQGALQAKVAAVNCTYAWTELLRRKLKLTGVTLDQPQIVLTKQATTPAPPQPPVGGPDSGAMEGPGAALPFQFILDRARINDGAVSVRNVNGAVMVELKGVDVDANTAGYTEGKDIAGTLKVSEIVVPPSMQITRFSTPFTYGDKTGLTAKSFEATAYNGNIAGDFQPQGSAPSILNLNGKGFNVGQLTAATTSNSSAKLTGTLDFQSKWRGVESGDLNGEGDAQITDGKLEGVRFLQEVGQILKIKELSEPIIKKGTTHFVVQGRQTQLIGLQIESSIFNITGGGSISFDGPLNLELVLILHREAMSKLPKELAASFVAAQDGTGSVGFHVGGTTANPQTDLPQRLLLQNKQIENVINKAINKLFH